LDNLKTINSKSIKADKNQSRWSLSSERKG
jgi:hypothetical protein